MKLPPFTLVHDPRTSHGNIARRRASRINDSPRFLATVPLSRFTTIDLAQGDFFGRLRPALQQTLANTYVRDTAIQSVSTSPATTMAFPLGFSVASNRASEDAFRVFSVSTDLPNGEWSPQLPFSFDPSFETVLTDLARQRKVTTVGLWDLGAWAARLGEVIKKVNESQSDLTFFDVQAAIPTGSISRRERVIAWAEEIIRSRRMESLSESQRMEIADNIIADDFLPRAEKVRADLGIDYLGGITPSMIADAEEKLSWNLFVTSGDRTFLVSSYDLREYTARARRPFEVGIVMLALAGFLVLANGDFDYHEDEDEDTGCLFDKNIQRDSLVRGLRELKIDEACLSKLQKKWRAPAQAILQALSGLT